MKTISGHAEGEERDSWRGEEAPSIAEWDKHRGNSEEGRGEGHDTEQSKGRAQRHTSTCLDTPQQGTTKSTP